MPAEEREDAARFAFRAPGFEVEFRGTEAFVREQIDRVEARLRAAMKGAGTLPAEAAAPAAAAEEKKGGSPLEEFYLKAKTREGRGALQDSILIFAYYVIEHQRKTEFSIEDLNFCFDLLNIQRPRSLANTLGILKRDRGWLESASRRGTYTLTVKGRERVSGLIGG
jgi:hypothetical protein